MKKTTSTKIEFPLVLSERGVSVTIYRTTSTKRGTEYESFILTWQSPDGRQRKSFSALDKAKAEAAAVMSGILSGRVTESLGLADAEMLKRIRMEVDAIGRPVLSILEEYAAARKILADSASIIDAARYWHDHVGRITQIQVADGFEKFKEAHANEWSDFHARDNRKRGRGFVAAMRCNVHEVSRAALKTFLDTTSSSGSVWNKKFEVVSAFLNLSSECGYISPEAVASLERNWTTGKAHKRPFRPPPQSPILCSCVQSEG